VRPDDDKGMSGQRLAREGPAERFLDLYDRALPQVYGYLLARCGQRAVAEDLTAETFLAAVDAVRAVRGGPPASLSTGWLIGVARHKLCDHWRRLAREERTLRAVAAEPGPGPADPWDEALDAVTARKVLGRLGPHHRAALTLRYVDDLPVPEVAAILGRRLRRTGRVRQLLRLRGQREHQPARPACRRGPAIRRGARGHARFRPVVPGLDDGGGAAGPQHPAVPGGHRHPGRTASQRSPGSYRAFPRHGTASPCRRPAGRRQPAGAAQRWRAECPRQP
jgi:RNA polymerase sigma-70 factor, ECF subfamily